MYLTLKSDAIQMHLKCMLLLYIMYLHVRLSHSNKGYLLTYLFKDSRIYVTRVKQSTVQLWSKHHRPTCTDQWPTARLTSCRQWTLGILSHDSCTINHRGLLLTFIGR